MRFEWPIAATWAAALTLFMAGPHGLPPAVPSAASAQDDSGLLRELAERLLDQQTPYYSAPGATRQRVQLLPGRLPDDPWFALPIPPGGRVVGSVVRTTEGQRPSVSVVFDVPGSPQEVEAFFGGAILGLGWQPAPLGNTSTGGFQPPQTLRYQWFCQEVGPAPSPNDVGPGLTLSVSPSLTGTNDVRLSSTSSGPPCWTPTLPSSAGPGGRSVTNPFTLPPLRPPNDVQLEQQGGSGGRGTYGSNAIATTTRSPADLATVFGHQLEAAGWVHLAGRADDPLAWSTWRVPTDDDEQLGTLLVLRTPGENRRWLSVQIYSASTDPSGSYYGVPSYPYPR